MYKNAKVYLNDTFIGGAAYGYIPFFADADGSLREGKNVLRVECENRRQPDSRWYTGAGIYRPVWLWIGEKCHIKPEGVRVTTLSYLPARIAIDVEHTGGENCDILTEIFDGNTLVASSDMSELPIPAAKLWSDESPFLYRCCVTLMQDGRICDTAEVRFGIRKTEWSSKAMATQLVLDAVQLNDLNACVVQPSGILGPKDYAMGTVTGTILKILQGGMATGMDGSFNLCDVRDLAHSCVMAIQNGRKGECYILGNEEVTLREMCDLLHKDTGCAMPENYLPLDMAYRIAEQQEAEAKKPAKCRL